MDLDRAEQIVQEVIDGRKRWGTMYGSGVHSASELQEALVTLDEQAEIGESLQAGVVTKLKRQLAASNARETKLKNLLKALDADRDQQTAAFVRQEAKIKRLEDEVLMLKASVDSYKAQIAGIGND